MHDFEYKIAQFIASEHLLARDAKVIVGLSGGADSIALLSVLCTLGYRCVAAHCNFGLRGNEADRDQAHARDTAHRLGAEWTTISFDTKAYMRSHGMSAEMACRELRYEWFGRLLDTYGAEAVAVAHHRNDNVETLLLNLLRGAGIHGLRGMRPRNGSIIRPLLNCDRTDVISYLADKGLSYVTDSSNLINDVKRNRLRNIILPALNSEFPGATDAIVRSISALRDNELIIDEAAASAAERYATDRDIDLNTLFGEHPDTAHALLFEILYPMGFNATHIRDIAEAHRNGKSGRQFHAAGHTAMLDRGRLIFSATPQPADSDIEHAVAIDRDIEHPIRLKTEHLSPSEFASQRNAYILYLDADAALAPGRRWTLRRWRNGDRMKPFGMNGSKKLSDIFSDAKLSVSQKGQMWLLTCDNNIVWIPGIRSSDLFKVTAATSDILKITYIPQTDEDHRTENRDTLI